MVMGRIGILTFGIAVATRDEHPYAAKDNELVL